MPEALAQASYLLAVGMIAVFTILGLVVLLGHGLIWVVNRYFPVKEAFTPRASSPPPNQKTASPTNPALLAVIVATVEEVTDGHGRIRSVRSLD